MANSVANFLYGKSFVFLFFNSHDECKKTNTAKTYSSCKNS